MPKDSMFYATLEEAIDAAREEFLANNPDSDEESANVEQLNIQKYVLQDEELLSAGFSLGDSGDIADQNTLHEWDEGEFQLEPSLDTEEGQTAADEWDER